MTSNYDKRKNDLIYGGGTIAGGLGAGAGVKYAQSNKSLRAKWKAYDAKDNRKYRLHADGAEDAAKIARKLGRGAAIVGGAAGLGYLANERYGIKPKKVKKSLSGHDAFGVDS